MALVLIVEDDAFKSDNLLALVQSKIRHAEVRRVSDVSSAIAAVNAVRFDLILIDMALPSHPIVSGGGPPMSLLTGGLEVLFELQSLDHQVDCIIVTQYPEIEISGRFFPVKQAAAAMREEFQTPVVACLEYSEDSVDWMVLLSKLLEKYENLGA